MSYLVTLVVIRSLLQNIITESYSYNSLKLLFYFFSVIMVPYYI
ncbi:hypothetical protein PRUPE_3G297200 [Prunus persica]|uniref:Uncharacterized protein n=1 Tax=Prunus persica TaxID=3760 RepID=A0A251Q7H7_PRUPE|nr:hypothetical protein PRUPE_3G297200 [Prunus persica]